MRVMQTCADLLRFARRLSIDPATVLVLYGTRTEAAR